MSDLQRLDGHVPPSVSSDSNDAQRDISSLKHVLEDNVEKGDKSLDDAEVEPLFTLTPSQSSPRFLTRLKGRCWAVVDYLHRNQHSLPVQDEAKFSAPPLLEPPPARKKPSINQQFQNMNLQKEQAREGDRAKLLGTDKLPPSDPGAFANTRSQTIDWTDPDSIAGLNTKE